MKNEAKRRIRYYVSVFYPVFSENSAKNDYLCREVFQEKFRLLEVENILGVGRRSFRTLIPVLSPSRKRQRISNLTPVQLLNIPIFTHSVTH